jgi:hypothetical protein
MALSYVWPSQPNVPDDLARQIKLHRIFQDVSPTCVDIRAKALPSVTAPAGIDNKTEIIGWRINPDWEEPRECRSGSRKDTPVKCSRACSSAPLPFAYILIDLERNTKKKIKKKIKVGVFSSIL